MLRERIAHVLREVAQFSTLQVSQRGKQLTKYCSQVLDWYKKTGSYRAKKALNLGKPYKFPDKQKIFSYLKGHPESLGYALKK